MKLQSEKRKREEVSEHFTTRIASGTECESIYARQTYVYFSLILHLSLKYVFSLSVTSRIEIFMNCTVYFNKKITDFWIVLDFSCGNKIVQILFPWTFVLTCTYEKVSNLTTYGCRGDSWTFRGWCPAQNLSGSRQILQLKSKMHKNLEFL